MLLTLHLPPLLWRFGKRDSSKSSIYQRKQHAPNSSAVSNSYCLWNHIKHDSTSTEVNRHVLKGFDCFLGGIVWRALSVNFGGEIQSRAEQCWSLIHGQVQIFTQLWSVINMSRFQQFDRSKTSFLRYVILLDPSFLNFYKRMWRV